MPARELMLGRLEEIGESLRASGRALALLGLGSVGRETERLDEFSDLDFFAVVQPGEKAAFLADLGWLRRTCPIAFSYRNTPDGHKVLFEDGVFCEFAVFEPGELAAIPFSEGRVVWKQEGFEASLLAPRRPLPNPELGSVEWLLGEALTSIYVGLCRLRRGEKLAALRLVQGAAVDLALRLVDASETEQPGLRDPFAPERRFERRFPLLAGGLPTLLGGYERTPDSALALLAFLERRSEVNAAMAAAIRSLA